MGWQRIALQGALVASACLVCEVGRCRSLAVVPFLLAQSYAIPGAYLSLVIVVIFVPLARVLRWDDKSRG